MQGAPSFGGLTVSSRSKKRQGCQEGLVSQPATDTAVNRNGTISNCQLKEKGKEINTVNKASMTSACVLYCTVQYQLFCCVSGTCASKKRVYSTVCGLGQRGCNPVSSSTRSAVRRDFRSLCPKTTLIGALKEGSLLRLLSDVYRIHKSRYKSRKRKRKVWTE